MKLKSFGCSFIFGTDLADDGRDGIYATPSQLTWPAHLARNLDLEYECHARPGSGNLQILERMLNQVPSSDDSDLFVVGWTWMDRFDHYDINHNPAIKRTPWSTIMPIDETPLAHTYYKHLHSEYQAKFASLSYVKLAIDTLDQRGIPFIMTVMDELIFDRVWHSTSGTLMLQDLVRPRLTAFEDQTFLNWSRGHGYAESPAWHPLEQAHAAAGKYMTEKYLKKT
jgi:hypothetical protein